MPPDQPDSSDSRLRLRFYVGGDLRDQVWIDAADGAAGDIAQHVATYHGHMAELADAAGLLWAVEVYDPASPPDQAYLRFGTDTNGMVAPQPATPEAWRLAGKRYPPAARPT